MDCELPDAMTIADYIKTNAPKGAEVAVLGSEPEIYFYSWRHSATGYIYMYPMMEQHAFALKMQEEMIGEIERAGCLEAFIGRFLEKRGEG